MLKKLHPFVKGDPDRVLLGQVRYALIEFKRPDEDANPQQKIRHNMLRGQGYKVYIIRSYSEFIDVMDKVL